MASVGHAWAHARQFNRQFILDEDKSIQDQVRAKGVTITKPDASPFRQATEGVYNEFYAAPAGKDARKIRRRDSGRCLCGADTQRRKAH